MAKIYTIMFFVSIVLMLAAISTFSIFGLNLGVDFEGGSIMELEFSNRVPPVEDVQRFLKTALPSEEFSFNLSGERGMVIRSGDLSEEAHRAVLNVFKENYPDEKVEEKQ